MDIPDDVQRLIKDLNDRQDRDFIERARQELGRHIVVVFRKGGRIKQEMRYDSESDSKDELIAIRCALGIVAHNRPINIDLIGQGFMGWLYWEIPSPPSKPPTREELIKIQCPVRVADVVEDLSTGTTTIYFESVVFHYCGVDAFRKIIKSNKLWLSDCYYMNDYMEHRFLIGKAIDLLKKQENDPDPITSQAATLFLDVLCNSTAHPYICCLSFAVDLLSQWRAYADNGAGFAIGFRAAGLEADMKAADDSISLVEVLYDPRKYMPYLEGHLQMYVQAIRAIGSTDVCNDIHCRSTANIFHTQIWTKASVTKDGAFEEEHECRLVSARNDVLTTHLRFRTSGANIIPYCAFPFRPENVCEIKLGPKNPARDNPHSLQLMLETNGYEKVAVGKSRATYR